VAASGDWAVSGEAMHDRSPLAGDLPTGAERVLDDQRLSELPPERLEHVMAAAAMSCRWRRVCFEDVPSLIRYAARAFCLIQLACYLKNITIDRGLKTQLLTLGHLDNLIRASPTH